MSAARGTRRVLGGLLALVCLLTVVGVQERAEPQVAPAADLSMFDPGNIITDAVFHDSGSMTEAQVQSFLDAKGANCRQSSSGPACLKDYRQQTVTRAADALCPGTYEGAADESAAAIITKVAVACDISPRVLLVTLQKEMGFITSSGPTWKMYTRAMGYGCPDNNGGVCDSYYNGFFNQLYSAARQFQRYAANPTRYGHVPGLWNNVRFHPNSACASSKVLIKNQATASLYNYTPYQPNRAALAAGYAAADDACASYGNRNFWNYFTDWFGSTQQPGRDVDAPVGRLEAVVDRGGSVLVRGWTYDPNAPDAAMQVNVYAGGTMIGSATTDLARPDVAAANPGVGSTQGFKDQFRLATGVHTVCAYPVNIGAGYSNPRLGCDTVRITPEAEWNPVGDVADVRVAGNRLVVEGWSFDPDAPRWPTTVRLYAGSTRLADVVADQPWAAVGRRYPYAGTAHGMSFETRLHTGSHRVCAYALNKGSGTSHPKLGCRTVTVTATTPAPPVRTGDPLGRLLSVRHTGSAVVVGGWAFDPDRPMDSVRVRAYVGSESLGTVWANRSQSAVGRAYPHAGPQHGFYLSRDLPAGTHEICVDAFDIVNGDNARLGCSSVTVPPAEEASGEQAVPGGSPKGRLASVEVNGSDVTLRGWAFDPDVATTAMTVRVKAGTTRLGDVVAGEDWPDVGKYYPYAGSAHGFTWTGTFEAGTHEVCLFGLNVGLGTTLPAFGCGTVTVEGSGVSAEEAPAPEAEEPVADPAGNPKGRLATVEVDGTGVRLAGWSFDPDVPTAPVTVRIYAGSRKLGDVVADEDWPDVGKYYPYAGSAHGYSFEGTLEPGSHLVCVYAFNQGNGTTNPRIGCRTVTVE